MDRIFLRTFLLFISVINISNAQEITTLTGTLSLSIPEGRHTVDFREGQYFSVDLSARFDTFLQIKSPEGHILSNDDYSGTNSRIESVAKSDGQWEIIATYYQAANENLGPYELRIEKAEVNPEHIEISGIMDRPSFKSGLYSAHALDLRPGQSFFISIVPGKVGDAATSSIRGYVHSPAGDVYAYRSAGEVLEFTRKVDIPGEWEIFITNDADQAVPLTYTGDIYIFESPDNLEYFASFGDELGGDESSRIPTGEFIRVHRWDVDNIDNDLIFEMATADLSDFDAYLVVVTAGGQTYYNDDSDDPVSNAFQTFKSTDSRIEVQSSSLTEEDIGEWQIIATSYGSNARGDYEIRVLRE